MRGKLLARALLLGCAYIASQVAWVPCTDTRVTRRALLQLPVLLAPPAFAEESKRLAVVESYPPFATLVPLAGVFGLVQSAAQASSADALSDMKKRFKALSDTDLDAYRFVCTQYVGLIKYADPDDKVVSFDKAGRFKACDDAMTAVGRARDVLQKDQEKAEFQKQVSATGINLASYFALVPKEDFAKAQALSQKMRALDEDRDYKLSAEEAKTVRSGAQPLSQEESEVVVALRSIGMGNLLIP
ncbi:unnamed protein product [Effrenium voratum]|uniref:Uncharacterized protein n=1 Tax=Effrenium voratum TaxID=2562239 RepID=A0AA36NCZ8_9DINO|nr:unnamed protein product [Effrenium voratum]